MGPIEAAFLRVEGELCSTPGIGRKDVTCGSVVVFDRASQAIRRPRRTHDAFAKLRACTAAKAAQALLRFAGSTLFFPA